jgi:hypothetical protein
MNVRFQMEEYPHKSLIMFANIHSKLGSNLAIRQRVK